MEEFERQIFDAQQFIGRVTTMINSSEIIINSVLHQHQVSQTGSTLNRFKRFLKLAEKIGTEVDLVQLDKDLGSLNHVANITKHGNPVIGTNPQIFVYKGVGYTFDAKEIEKIDNLFTDIQKRLMQVGAKKKI
ncbi:MAG: hypothetical protein V1776_03780 [Candidatus Diapherotrites archaeon]